MVELISVYRERQAILILYDLLKEREPWQSISHKQMPTMDEHAAFVRSNPYTCWYLIRNEDGQYVGSIYLSKQREIGVFIFKEHAGKEYGTEALKMLMHKWPGKFYANVNPANEPSKKFFEKLGGKVIQQTYALQTTEETT